MIKALLASSSIALAAALLAGPAVAAPAWTDIGKDQLPGYGAAQLYVGHIARERDGKMAGQLRAVLDTPWSDPRTPGTYDDIYFKVLADCRAGTVGVMPSWPEGPDEASVPDRDLQRPAPGSAKAKLLRAYCGG